MKEAYRLQKGVLVDAIRTARAPHSRDGEPLEQQAVRLDIAIQFVAAEAKDFSLIYRKMTEVLSKLHKEYGKVYLGQDH